MKRSTVIAIAVVAAAAIGLLIINSDAQPQSNSKVIQVPATHYKPLPKGIGGKWNLDPMHSLIGFAVPHLMFNDVHGSFNDSEGTVIVDEKDIRKSSVTFSAKIASIDTNVAPRDAHLKSPDFFDAAKYPTLSFRSTRVDRTPNGGFKATGLFTMKGVTKRIVIPFTADGPVVDAFGYKRASVHADLALNRQDYGINYKQVLDNGRLGVGNIVKVTLDLEAIKEGTGPKKK